MHGTRAGFTVIELLLALSLGSLALLTSIMVLQQLAGAGDQFATLAREFDDDANGERAIRAVVRQLVAREDSLPTFDGNRQRALFTTWCDTPSGWKERCDASLALSGDVGSPALVARLSNGREVRTPIASSLGALIYLVDAELGGTWVHAWGRSLSAPLAIGVALPGDMLILSIGERR